MLNKYAIEQFGLQDRDYRVWCKKNKLKMSEQKSKELFFRLLLEGKLVRSERGNLVCKEK